MPRERTPDGKRVTICAKFSEAEAAQIDTARGLVTRSQWLRSAALAAGAIRRSRAAAPGDCPHPKARVIKGFCGACGTHVGA